MKIIALKKSGTVYSCNSYLILGDWNRVGDVNTLIDPGTDDFVIGEIEHISTGLGKIPVEQIVLTHTHFDHGGGVDAIKRRFGARVLAFTRAGGVDECIRNGQFVRAGDGILEVIHIPGHSSDSICLYAPSARALFSGDMQVRVRTPGDAYTKEYRDGLDRLAALNIETIYPGHDNPISTGVRETLRETLVNVRNSRITGIDRRPCISPTT
jgi:glyoxylase-like metal-dependent hydrolase (beta-lactamase superfamily II)